MAIGDMMGMMKQAKALQEKMEQLQQEVGAMEVEGSSGGGLVTVVMTGKSEMKRHFTADHVFQMGGSFRIQLRLKKKNKAFASGSISVQVRPGIGEGRGSAPSLSKGY